MAVDCEEGDRNPYEDHSEDEREEENRSERGEGVPGLKAEPVEASFVLVGHRFLPHVGNITMRKHPKVILLGETRNSPSPRRWQNQSHSGSLARPLPGKDLQYSWGLLPPF